jgi:hypothetical protein
MWLRLRIAGLPPDEAIEHMSRLRLIILGLKGLIVVGLLLTIPCIHACASILPTNPPR